VKLKEPSEQTEAKPAKKGKELKILDPKTGQNLCKYFQAGM